MVSTSLYKSPFTTAFNKGLKVKVKAPSKQTPSAKDSLHCCRAEEGSLQDYLKPVEILSFTGLCPHLGLNGWVVAAADLESSTFQ